MEWFDALFTMGAVVAITVAVTLGVTGHIKGSMLAQTIAFLILLADNIVLRNLRKSK